MLSIEFRFAEGGYERLPGLAAELVRHPVAVLVASGFTATIVAKAATATIPIVFNTGGDPVRLGLVDSLARPGGNVTGVATFGKVLGGQATRTSRGAASEGDSDRVPAQPEERSCARGHR